jgi:uncharacterized delta-60 repeat protein
MVVSIAVQADGKLLIGGTFTTLQPNGAASPTTRNHIARLNTDGTLDTTFNPNANDTVSSVAVQEDGKVLLGGSFTTLQPNSATSATGRNRVARINANGTLDTTFNPNATDRVYSVAVQADGKVLLGGVFTSLQPNGSASATLRHYLARVHANGMLDTTFNPNPGGRVKSVAVQADGKVLLGGIFKTLWPSGALGPTTRNYIARVNPDGTVDTSFDPNPNNYVTSVAVDGTRFNRYLGGEYRRASYNPVTGAIVIAADDEQHICHV